MEKMEETENRQGSRIELKKTQRGYTWSIIVTADATKKELNRIRLLATEQDAFLRRDLDDVCDLALPPTRSGPPGMPRG